MTDPTLPDNGARHRVDNATIDGYRAQLLEKSRPPFRGGNTRAWHYHVIRIGEQDYSFRALGSRKWAYKNDTVSFEWKWNPAQRYRDIITETFEARDKSGVIVERGHRGSKPWRSDTRAGLR